MRPSLFDRVSYARLAERHARVLSEARVRQCERLRELGETADEDRVCIDVNVAPHAHGVQLTGRVHGQVTVACRRCLGALCVAVDRAVALLVVGTEAALRAVPEQEDVHHAPDLTGRLVDILEEEVLLALPDYPAHEDGRCETLALPQGIEQVDAQHAADEDDRAPTQRPFAAALRPITKKLND